MPSNQPLFSVTLSFLPSRSKVPLVLRCITHVKRGTSHVASCASHLYCVQHAWQNIFPTNLRNVKQNKNVARVEQRDEHAPVAAASARGGLEDCYRKGGNHHQLNCNATSSCGQTRWTGGHLHNLPVAARVGGVGAQLVCTPAMVQLETARNHDKIKTTTRLSEGTTHATRVGALVYFMVALPAVARRGQPRFIRLHAQHLSRCEDDDTSSEDHNKNKETMMTCS